MKENRISKIIKKLEKLNDENLTLVEEATNTCANMQRLEIIKELNNKNEK